MLFRSQVAGASGAPGCAVVWREGRRAPAPSTAVCSPAAARTLGIDLYLLWFASSDRPAGCAGGASVAAGPRSGDECAFGTRFGDECAEGPPGGWGPRNGGAVPDSEKIGADRQTTNKNFDPEFRYPDQNLIQKF